MITTKYGVFEVSDNGNGGASLFMNDVKVCEFPKIAWWNVDGITAAVEEHHELIEKRIAERVNVSKVTRENAAEVVAQLIEVFGNENKNFYSSRLKQIYNKLKA